MADLNELLSPLPGADPAGPSLRYERSMTEIRRAREADDPSLPMGEWDRPLKKADWPVVLGTCLLAERSKDLQLAARLTEAWVHLHDLDGLVAGISLLVGLVERHWDGVHPRIDDDGDCDARIAPLVWLNENLPMTLRQRHQQLLNAAGEWARLRSVLDERLGPDGPSFGRGWPTR